ncbi:NAD(P)/FAD-dependent oxidoreductase [Rhizobium sp. WL3]|uniref:NAD(P)/FAD-dependent oxidoreductase n=1 Tax=Rhizobium sp. WL3 TaxID=2603277 RepID=UPI001AED67A2|nr:NAD(P)/FAD-dependent oxidoreductase [Rhizobium sp. WL3]
MKSTKRPHVVIVGAGFGGLACAQALGNTEIDVTVIDRRNHNLFQPLLYQVATAALSPADISEPIRRTLGRYDNIHVVMAEVASVDAPTQTAILKDGGSIPFERLVLATGSTYNYFGNPDWPQHAPGLKSIHEARDIRHRLLLAFEKAERSTDEQEKRRLLTSVIIGGGPTGVEMAGAISELGRFMIAQDFRTLQADQLKVLLIEAGPRILSTFPEKLSQYASDYLAGIGVDIRLNTPVEDITAEGVQVAGEFVPASCMVWGAGVKASPAAEWLGVEPGPGGRLPVASDLSVAGRPGIYALGDTALALGEDGKPLPALAQVAKQQGEFLGRALKGDLLSGKPIPSFRFHNRGNTAVIGRNAAIFDFGRWQLKGRLAWLLWALVHVYLLVNFEKRLLVSIQWIWRYSTRQRGARVIDEKAVSLVTPEVAAEVNRSS